MVKNSNTFASKDILLLIGPISCIVILYFIYVFSGGVLSSISMQYISAFTVSVIVLISMFTALGIIISLVGTIKSMFDLNKKIEHAKTRFVLGVIGLLSYLMLAIVVYYLSLFVIVGCNFGTATTC